MREERRKRIFRRNSHDPADRRFYLRYYSAWGPLGFYTAGQRFNGSSLETRFQYLWAPDATRIHGSDTTRIRMRIHVSIMTRAHSATGYHAHRKGEQVDEGGWGENNSTHVDNFHYFDNWSNENPRFIRTRESRSDGNSRFIKNQEVEDRSAQRERFTTTYTIFIVYNRSALRDGIEGGKFRRNL